MSLCMRVGVPSSNRAERRVTLHRKISLVIFMLTMNETTITDFSIMVRCTKTWHQNITLNWCRDIRVLSVRYINPTSCQKYLGKLRRWYIKNWTGNSENDLPIQSRCSVTFLRGDYVWSRRYFTRCAQLAVKRHKTFSDTHPLRFSISLM